MLLTTTHRSVGLATRMFLLSCNQVKGCLAQLVFAEQSINGPELYKPGASGLEIAGVRANRDNSWQCGGLAQTRPAVLRMARSLANLVELNLPSNHG
jgi:hypothetical protein